MHDLNFHLLWHLPIKNLVHNFCIIPFTKTFIIFLPVLFQNDKRIGLYIVENPLICLKNVKCNVKNNIVVNENNIVFDICQKAHTVGFSKRSDIVFNIVPLSCKVFFLYLRGFSEAEKLLADDAS